MFILYDILYIISWFQIARQSLESSSAETSSVLTRRWNVMDVMIAGITPTNGMAVVNTVLSQYIAVIFLQIAHERHPP